MKKILFITSKEDEHSDYIIRKISERNYKSDIIRINTEDFASNIIASFNGSNFNVKILDSKRTFCSDEIISVWYRRPLPIKTSYSEDHDVNKFIDSQWKIFLEALYSCTKDNALWVNPLESQIYAKNKIYQLKIAKECGLKIPEVLVTNDKEETKQFFKNHNIICNKSLTVPRYTMNNQQFSYMTKIVDKKIFEENMNSITICPTLFEQYIEKDSDIRVVVFGNEIYAFEILSQTQELSKIDYRGLSPELLKHRQIFLPDNIKNKILNFMKKQNLFFSSMDLVKIKEEYYFIENNNNGQWLWLEYLTGVDLSTRFIELLVNGKIE